jgi:hypothetical protein
MRYLSYPVNRQKCTPPLARHRQESLVGCQARQQGVRTSVRAAGERGHTRFPSRFIALVGVPSPAAGSAHPTTDTDVSVMSGGADRVSAAPDLLPPRVAYSHDPRDRRSDCRQRPHHAAEMRRRATVVRCAARLHGAGATWCAAARAVHTPARTLRDWKAPRRVWASRRGRLPLVASRAERNAVLHFVGQHVVVGELSGLRQPARRHR